MNSVFRVPRPFRSAGKRAAFSWASFPAFLEPSSVPPSGTGVTLSDSYNRALRLTGLTSSLNDSNHPGTLLSVTSYNAFGGELSGTLGSGLAVARTYTPRGGLSTLTDGPSGSPVYNLSMTSYAPNGDPLVASDSVNGNWNYAYDDFNRLCASNQGGQTSLSCSSSNNTGTQAYKYVFDRFGNRWQQNVTAGSGHMSSLGFDANNRITSGSGVTYDAAGNTTNDGTHAYTFDAENRITQLDAGATAIYVYNASGERVRKTTSSGSVDYLYDLAGHSITELSSSGGWNRGEVYAGGKHLATYSGGTSGTTYFIHADWLGTERARSTSSGSPYESCVSLPFGDGQSCTGGDPSPLHFTGKQRDSESNLDFFGARYLSSQQGRFMTPDWAAVPIAVPYAHFGDPQSLNSYAYASNNPSSRDDPDGHCGGEPNAGTCNNVTVKAEPTEQPSIKKNQTVPKADGGTAKVTSVEGTVTFTVSINGRPSEGVKVTEQNEVTTTRNGKDVASQTANGKQTTNSQGQVTDRVGTSLLTDGSKASNDSNKSDFTKNTWTVTDKQTLTLTLSTGDTCSATSTRTVTNAGANGPNSNYTLTTTQPVVKPN